MLRLVRGEDLKVLSRELEVPGETLRQWRKRFIAGGEASLRARGVASRDEELRQLKILLGELILRNDRLQQQLRSGPLRLGTSLTLVRTETRTNSILPAK